MRTRGTGLAGSNAGGVTGSAVIAVDTEMIEGNAGETGKVTGIMARRTIQRRRYVTFRFTDTDRVVMTLGTVIHVNALVRKG